MRALADVRDWDSPCERVPPLPHAALRQAAQRTLPLGSAAARAKGLLAEPRDWQHCRRRWLVRHPAMRAGCPPTGTAPKPHRTRAGMAAASSTPEEGVAGDKKPFDSAHYKWAEEMKRRGEELKALGVDTTPKAIDAGSAEADDAGDALAKSKSKGSAWNTGGTW